MGSPRKSILMLPRNKREFSISLQGKLETETLQSRILSGKFYQGNDSVHVPSVRTLVDFSDPRDPMRKLLY